MTPLQCTKILLDHYRNIELLTKDNASELSAIRLNIDSSIYASFLNKYIEHGHFIKFNNVISLYKSIMQDSLKSLRNASHKSDKDMLYYKIIFHGYFSKTNITLRQLSEINCISYAMAKKYKSEAIKVFLNILQTKCTSQKYKDKISDNSPITNLSNSIIILLNLQEEKNENTTKNYCFHAS